MLLAFCFSFSMAQAMAQEAGKGIQVEIGTFLSDSPVSSSPISVTSTSNSSKSLRVIAPIGQYYGQNLRVTAGIDQQDSDLNMGGAYLGRLSNRTLSATVRDYPVEECKICPYGGLGFYQTSRAQASLAKGALTMESADSSGLLMEGGVSAMLPFFGGDKLYADFNLSKKMGTSRESKITTTVGNALVTKLGGSNDLDAKVSVGYKF